jgi:hypothetical protein
MVSMNRILICLVLLFAASQASAGHFTVLVAAKPGYETIDAIVDEHQQGGDYQTVELFNQFPPSTVEYLIKSRPTNPPPPHSTHGTLLRYLIVSYPYPTDVSTVADFFEQSELFESVFYDSPLDPVHISPEVPTINDPITVTAHIPLFQCGNISGPSVNPQGLSQYVSTDGFESWLDAVIYFSPPGQPTGCVVQPHIELTFELGQLPAGQHNLHFSSVLDDVLFPTDENHRITHGSLSFNVRGNQVAVPALQPLTLLIFMFTMVIMVIRKQSKTQIH